MSSETARWITDGLGFIDLNFRDSPYLIAAYVARTDDGLAVIECGPGSTTDRLLAGIRELGLDPQDLKHVIVTHIHLDHAGAAGVLLQRFPESRLYVHEIGAPHMIDPSRLLKSAERIYGAMMESLWGEVLPCPQERVTVVGDGDVLNIGGLRLEALYTPGHASHHLAFHDAARDLVFAGDVAGVRLPSSSLVWPPTPPPDIDVEAWHASIARVRDLNPSRLLLTHFGPFEDVDGHLDQLEARLDTWARLVEQWQADGLERDEMVERLGDHARSEIEEHGEASEIADASATVTPYGMAVDGLLRYLRKRSESAG